MFSACGTSDFLCPVEKTCIPDSWKCDRYHDCSDGADEVGCKLLPYMGYIYIYRVYVLYIQYWCYI